MSKDRMAYIWDVVEALGGTEAMGITSIQLLTLLCLANHENDRTRRIDPSSEMVGKLIGTCDDTVLPNWGKLRAMGLLIHKSGGKKEQLTIDWGFGKELGQMPDRIVVEWPSMAHDT
jgi:hypothetical protein